MIQASPHLTVCAESDEGSAQNPRQRMDGSTCEVNVLTGHPQAGRCGRTREDVTGKETVTQRMGTVHETIEEEREEFEKNNKNKRRIILKVHKFIFFLSYLDFLNENPLNI